MQNQKLSRYLISWSLDGGDIISLVSWVKMMYNAEACCACLVRRLRHFLLT